MLEYSSYGQLHLLYQTGLSKRKTGYVGRVLFNRIVLSEKGKKKGKKDQGRIRFRFPLIGRPLVDQPGSDVSLKLSVELPCEDEYNGYARCKPAGHESGRAARGASGG